MKTSDTRATTQPPKAPRRAGAGADGFLLVEVLATMTISAFVLVGLLSVASVTLRASNRAATSSAAIEDISRITASLRRDISQASPLRWAGDGGAFVFQGVPQRLLFAQQVQSADGTTVARVVVLESDGKHLFRSAYGLLPSDRSLVADRLSARDLMGNRPANTQFAFFGSTETGLETLTDTWTDTTRLPVAVRVTFVGINGKLLTSTRIAINIDAEPGCAMPGKGKCSLAPDVASDDEDQAEVLESVNADDPLGWERYAR